MTDDIDAKRYRALRRMAMVEGSLEFFVAYHQLDFVGDAERFDRIIDEAICRIAGDVIPAGESGMTTADLEESSLEQKNEALLQEISVLAATLESQTRKIDDLHAQVNKLGTALQEIELLVERTK